MEYCQSHPEHLVPEMHPSWGLAHIPESELGLLPPRINEEEYLVDLGCGRGHDTKGFAEMGYEALGVDLSEEQISRALHHKRARYLVGSAERLPLASASVSVVVSDHGAFDHSPSEPLLREVHRVLKPAGTLIVCTYSPIALSCFDHKTGRITRMLVNQYPVGLTRYDGSIVATERNYSNWIKQFRTRGFIVDRLEEPLLQDGDRIYFDEMVDKKWALNWPVDLIWVVRKE